MYCGKCGAQVPEGADQCSACAQPVTPQVEPSETPANPTVRRVTPAYAGFWLRLAAFLIDLILVGLVLGPITYKPLVSNIGPDASPKDVLAFYMGGTTQAFAISMLVQMGYWLYYASLESSRWQATVGKRLLGLYVTDLSGNHISFARASGRHFAKLLSQFILMLGFLMAGFTEKKQALHDMLAGCLVLKKN